MSKRRALRALKLERMAARQGYKMHLLDLWARACFTDSFELPGQGTSHHRAYLKRRMVRPMTTRP